ncbi:MAG: sigma 54-interacting transcriptional regulator [Sporomusaceae bacterium]|nr:sigma 54-interacting transcriptional regulator [Sporomusaceae bacterium]
MGQPRQRDVMETWYGQILDSLNNGILVIDHKQIVQYINDEYTRITGVKKEQILGRILSDVRPGAMLPKVIATGKAVYGAYRREGDIEYVADMAPIRVNGAICGGVSVVKDITEVRRLTAEVERVTKRSRQLKNLVDRLYQVKYTFDDILGQSKALQETIHIAQKAAQCDADILIYGASGTGKELFAQAIHHASARRSGPFVAINCAAIAPNLVESELFGYEEGSFTGAKKGGRIGLFEMASGGTLFLDEIAELPLETQAKLLRVLQERTIRRIGEMAEISLDLRIIAATHQDLYQLTSENKFRSDVYYRLNVMNFTVPSLKERQEDIALLAKYFFSAAMKKAGRSVLIDTSVYSALLNYDWPGNVRELKNMAEYAVNMCDETTLTLSHLPKRLAPGNLDEFNYTESLAVLVKDFERRTLQRLLATHGTSLAAKRQIADKMGISLATLYNKLKEIKKLH